MATLEEKYQQQKELPDQHTQEMVQSNDGDDTGCESSLLMQPVRRQDNFSPLSGETQQLQSIEYSGSSPSAPYRLVDSTADHKANSGSGLDRPGLDKVRQVGIDEKSFSARQDYVSVMTDIDHS